MTTQNTARFGKSHEFLCFILALTTPSCFVLDFATHFAHSFSPSKPCRAAQQRITMGFSLLDRKVSAITFLQELRSYGGTSTPYRYVSLSCKISSSRLALNYRNGEILSTRASPFPSNYKINIEIWLQLSKLGITPPRFSSHKVIYYVLDRKNSSSNMILKRKSKH